MLISFWILASFDKPSKCVCIFLLVYCDVVISCRAFAHCFCSLSFSLSLSLALSLFRLHICFLLLLLCCFLYLAFSFSFLHCPIVFSHASLLSSHNHPILMSRSLVLVVLCCCYFHIVVARSLSTSSVLSFVSSRSVAMSWFLFAFCLLRVLFSVNLRRYFYLVLSVYIHANMCFIYLGGSLVGSLLVCCCASLLACWLAGRLPC